MSERPKITPSEVIEIYTERKQILEDQLQNLTDASEVTKRHWRHEIAKCERIIRQNEDDLVIIRKPAPGDPENRHVGEPA